MFVRKSSPMSVCWDCQATPWHRGGQGVARVWAQRCCGCFQGPRCGWGSLGPLPARDMELAATHSRHGHSLLGNSWAAQCQAHSWWFPGHTAQNYETSNQKTSCFKWTSFIHSRTQKHFGDRVQRNRACFYKTCKFLDLAGLPPSLIKKQTPKQPPK